RSQVRSLPGPFSRRSGRHSGMLAPTTAALHPGDDFAYVGADEGGRRFWHFAKRTEHGLRRLRILLGLEQPERMLYDLAALVERARPVRGPGAGHAADERRSVLARHHRSLLFMTGLDLDAPHKCIHRSSLDG